MHVAVTPSATPLLTREQIFKMKEAGVVRLGISLDGSCPEIVAQFTVSVTPSEPAMA